MENPSLSDCEFLGWALLDLDDPIPKRALHIAEQRGIQVEDFIEEAIAEKIARMNEADALKSASVASGNSVPTI